MDRTREPTGEEIAERIKAATLIFDEHATMSLAVCSGPEPWVGRMFFVEDEPAAGRLDICCVVLAASKIAGALEAGEPVAFLVAGDGPDRWIQGVGIPEPVADEADAAAVMKRLHDKSDLAGPFLQRIDARAVRIHVRTLKVTDVAADPPIAEFTFA